MTATATATAYHAGSYGRPRTTRQRPGRPVLPRRRPHYHHNVERLECRMLLAADIGAFDAPFGNGGKARIDVEGLEDQGYWVQALPDGKLLVSGTAAFGVTVDPTSTAGAQVRSELARFVARLNGDGSLDETYGDDGIVRFDTAGLGFDSTTYELTVQADGKFLIPGNAWTDPALAMPPPPSTNWPAGGTQSIVVRPGGEKRAFAVVRYNIDGTLDDSFGAHGVATADLVPVEQERYGGGENASALAVQPDGKIVVAGHIGRSIARTSDYTLDSDIGVVRFNADGTVDEAFGRHREQSDTVADPSRTDGATVVRIQSDGKVLVGGQFGGWQDTSGFGLIRYNPDGTLDAGFGQGGHVLTIFPKPDAPGAANRGVIGDLLVQPDDRIVAAGMFAWDQVGLARYNPDGTLDDTFGGGGLVTMAGVAGGIYRLGYRPDSGAIEVGGLAYGNRQEVEHGPMDDLIRMVPTGFDAFTARISPAGQVLLTARATQLPFTGDERFMGSVSLQPDGKIVGVGTAYPTKWAGEDQGVWAQTADAQVVRVDPAKLTADATPALLYSGGAVAYSDNSGPADNPPPEALTVNLSTLPDTSKPPTGSNNGLVITNGLGGASNSFTLTPTIGATFFGRTAVRGGRVYSFRITYPTETLARQTSVSVTGPGGFSTAAQAAKVKLRQKAQPAAVVSYRAPAPGGKFDAADAGTYAVRLNATAGQAASGQIVGLFTVNAARPRNTNAPVPFRKLTVPGTGILRKTDSVPGSTTGWVLDRDDLGAAGEIAELDLGRFPGEAAALVNRRVTLTGVLLVVKGRAAPVFVVESIALAT